MEVDGERKRRIKLFCPSVSKVIQIIAPEEQKLDLGSIARVFGLDPNTLKLNGHFISRGVDLVASSVTWKSLIGFFSARGLSTGASDCDALIVDGGKLCKIGSKRLHDQEGAFNTNEKSDFRDCKKAKLEFDYCISLKRKLSLEDECELKRTKKADEAVSGPEERNGTDKRFSCILFDKNMKRMRGDEMASPSPLTKKNKIKDTWLNGWIDLGSSVIM